jgi:hypothetical protein
MGSWGQEEMVAGRKNGAGASGGTASIQRSAVFAFLLVLDKAQQLVDFGNELIVAS